MKKNPETTDAATINWHVSVLKTFFFFAFITYRRIKERNAVDWEWEDENTYTIIDRDLLYFLGY
jgi:hypothetical protein